jgi:hypothetical protein
MKTRFTTPNCFLALACITLLIFLGCVKSAVTPQIRKPQDPWFVRTDFSDDTKWRSLCAAVTAPQDASGAQRFAYVDLIDDSKYRDLTPLLLVNSLPDDYSKYFVLVADAASFSDSESTVLVVNFFPQFAESYSVLPRDRVATDIETFRAAPNTIQSIENNLSIGNMGFEEFAESVDVDGVFRGFAEP